ncbi:4Fe-4S ferredoxin iron-sulfur binding domain protein [Natrinema pellirubrum DSM 15624]|uniref:4Fe-4S ferredoxin iron-sulfur binding domain protein n=1 Tax=Natrinema pellirubrum (strain DSM 15624 / CIP 106293 / JCM 10476 / NCIMB 786 / 157) TaxID=797303 RepID=L0JLP3_NATP1|nr:4Fe-4S ferredoxin N-terminal domain-containing protein [Natrinema pellirubrum]AGB32199.1 Fe-S-cluster-containing hydrogenase subunit [Natrinema pellirubrum DSM 15624]ELY74978.1 4Fe-4S ferredoxin iron-sulfur binding domain protein [Natrinema pellirubrum DSM 15624]
MSTDDESFHPLGEEWEDELESMLDDTEYDSELGMEMAQDAMRVTKGELSEAEFHDRYHEEVMEEFGEDERPTKEAYEAAQEEAKGTASRMLDKFDGDGDETRRETMKKMGVGAAAVGMGAFGTVAEGPENSIAEEGGHGGPRQETTEESDTQWGMTIDLERCDGCLSCMTACTEENDIDKGVNWMYVMAWEDENHSGPGEEGGTDVYSDFNLGSDYNMLVRPCQHCTDAPCEKVCPTTARHTRDKDGIVLTDYDVCIGCRYCQVACPYGVNYFQWDEPDVAYEDIDGLENPEDPDEITHAEYEHGERWVDSRAPRGVMSKCTFCPSMQDGRQGEEHVGTTACERACPPNAIQFGNVNDERSDPSQHREHPSKSRAIVHLTNGTESPKSAPTADQIDSALSQGDDLETAIEQIDGLTEDILAVMKSIEMVSEGLEPGDEENNSILQNEQAIISAVETFQQYVDLDTEEAYDTLGLGDGSEQDVQMRLKQYTGDPSSFQLLEDVGTNPNVTYLGQQPGPEAHQVEGPTKYEDAGLLDKRQEYLDEETVGRIDGVSL